MMAGLENAKAEIYIVQTTFLLSA